MEGKHKLLMAEEDVADPRAQVWRDIRGVFRPLLRRTGSRYRPTRTPEELPQWGVSNLQPAARMRPRRAVNAAQLKVVRLLKTW